MEAVDPVGVEFGRIGEGRDPGLVEDLVGQQAADAGQAGLVPQVPVDALAGGGQAAGQFVAVDPVGVGAEAGQGLLALRVARHQPDPGPALGAGLGEQQIPAVSKRPSGHAAPGRFGRLFCGRFGGGGGLLGEGGRVVGAQAAALHEVDHEGEIAEVQADVLAPVAGTGELSARG